MAADKIPSIIHPTICIMSVDGENAPEEEDIEIPSTSVTLQEGEEENAQAFPEVFYCPISKKLLVDPVVASDGKSYERSLIEAQENFSQNDLYLNRALKSIMDERLEPQDDSFRAGLKRLQTSVRQNLSQMLQVDISDSVHHDPLPDAYFCPITFSLIHEPCIDREGNTFERVALENWIRCNGTSPITRTPLSVDDLYPNLAIKELMNQEKERSEDTMHPSIKIWKEESPPERMDPPESNTDLRSHSINATTPVTQSEQEEIRRVERARVFSFSICFFAFLVALILALLFGGIRVFVIALIVLAMCVQDGISSPR